MVVAASIILQGATLLHYQVAATVSRYALPQPPHQREKWSFPTGTSYAIKTVMSPILVVEVEGRWYPGRPLNENQQRVLRLAGFDEGIYRYGAFSGGRQNSRDPPRRCAECAFQEQDEGAKRHFTD